MTDQLIELAARRNEMRRSRNHSDRGPMTDWQWEQKQGWERHHYAIAKARAMRPCSRLAQAEMLATAARCVTQANQLRREARNEI